MRTSAATECAYYILYPIFVAKRRVAATEEIKTAVLIATDVMRMSTLFYVNEFDAPTFKPAYKWSICL